MKNLQETLRLHKLWLDCKVGGEKANLAGANLAGADLERADLERADLGGADLGEANLAGVSLAGADLERASLAGASLAGADLRGVNLWEANLAGTNLTRADLRGTDLIGATKVPMHCKWYHGVTDGKIHIGCEKRSVEEWKAFLEGDEMIETKRDTDEFRQIVKVIKAYIAYLEG